MKNPLRFFVFFLVLTSCVTPDKDATTTETGKHQSLSPTEDTNKNSDVPPKPKPMTNQSTCVSNKDTRIMEVKKTKFGGCELFYTKFGKTQSVATANIGTEYCEEVKKRIQANLEKAGFSCQ